MNPELKKSLIAEGYITEDQFREIEAHPTATNSSIDDILLKSKIIQVDEMGKCLSNIYKLPYVRLLKREPSLPAQDAISYSCARKWTAYPLDYDHENALLTLSVADPDQADKMEHIFKFLMEPFDLAFTLASTFEINEAIEARLANKQEHKQTPTLPPQQKDDKPKAKKMSLSSLHTQMKQKKEETTNPVPPAPKAKPMKQPVKPQPAPESIPKQEQSFPEEVLRSLTSAVSLMVTSQLNTKPKDLIHTRDRVRYCHLTATRLNLSPTQTTKVILAAWLSALDSNREIIKQFVNPFDLEKIIFPADSESEYSIESLILTLVRHYQNMEEENASECRDVNLVRRTLLVKCSYSSAHQDILETFLQVLMDEQFLDKFDQHAGSVLLVDPSTILASEVEPSLRRTGYEVNIISTTQNAVESVREYKPDLVIAGTDSTAKDLLAFCKAMKSDSDTSNTPLIAMLPLDADIRGAELLRAGADDFLTLPIDTEMLYLKLEKNLSTTTHTTTSAKEGVSGSLSDMSFSDLIQVLSASCKSTEIHLTNDNKEGLVVIKGGNIIHAQLGETSGDRAFYMIMQWHKGDFSMKECTEFPEPTITSSNMSLLMEGSRLSDENIDP